ncbi:MAG TPA: Uma2 family endonuclease, partial [Pyrinomonadaceae bacterium]|nr:Uma2 family endonuclease [Pyrinomonadaceae bacterium]
IEGGIYEMSPIGSPHAACVAALTLILGEVARRKFIVWVQNPIRLDDFSEPQPDISLLRWRNDFYRRAHPTPEDVMLVIEVAETTVRSDRGVKVPLYARAGVPEVWLVNLPEERVEIYAEPSGGKYTYARKIKRGSVARSRTVEGLAVNVADVVG